MILPQISSTSVLGESRRGVFPINYPKEFWDLGVIKKTKGKKRGNKNYKIKGFGEKEGFGGKKGVFFKRKCKKRKKIYVPAFGAVFFSCPLEGIHEIKKIFTN